MFSGSVILCPCGSGTLFSECCEKYISQHSLPLTAEQLMRSRYSAYRLRNEDYLLQTWHVSTRPANLSLQNDSILWKKLKIIASSADSVEFVAFFKDANKILWALYEKSFFIKEERWFYVQGEELSTIKLSKKLLCPCKSSKKFKHCCGTDL